MSSTPVFEGAAECWRLPQKRYILYILFAQQMGKTWVFELGLVPCVLIRII